MVAIRSVLRNEKKLSSALMGYVVLVRVLVFVIMLVSSIRVSKRVRTLQCFESPVAEESPCVAEWCSLWSSGMCEGFCENGGTCLQTSNGTKLCQCQSQFHGHNCEVNKCDYCGDGKCLTSASGEVSCRYMH